MNLEQKQPFLAESKESLSGTRNVLNTRSEKLKEGRGADSARWSA